MIEKIADAVASSTQSAGEPKPGQDHGDRATRWRASRAGKKGALKFACYATLKKVLRRARWRWRRTRRRTGKPPAPHRVAAPRKALCKLRAHERAGRVDLFYGDESGFSLNRSPSASHAGRKREETPSSTSVEYVEGRGASFAVQ